MQINKARVTTGIVTRDSIMNLGVTKRQAQQLLEIVSNMLNASI